MTQFKLWVCIGAIVLVGAAGYVLYADDLAFLTRVLAVAIFVMALDLVVGFCGVATLGHAVVFGAGAYGAGIACVNGLTEPVSLLLIGAVAGGFVGLINGALIVRFGGLPQLVLSIAFVQLMNALANKASRFTGGSDGLSGIEPGKILGLFAFDLYGRTAYVFALLVLLVTFTVLWRIVKSPFGLLCQGIKEDPIRVQSLGANVYPALVKMYGISGCVAGIAGAMAAITAGVVGLDSVSFEKSADALVMLVLGGTGSLYGALIGTAVFQLFEHAVSAANPFHWLTLVGCLLIAVVLFLAAWPAGHWRCLSQLAFKARGLMMAELLKIEGMSKSFGGLKVSQDINLTMNAGDRVALIGPNGAGKTTFINLVTGAVEPSAGKIFLSGEDVTGLSMVDRVQRGLIRSFQVTRLFKDRTVGENVALAVLQRQRRTGWMFANVRKMADTEREIAELLALLGIGDLIGLQVSQIAYGQQRLLEIALGACAEAPRSCCSTSQPPGSRRMRVRAYWRRSMACRPTLPC